VCLCVCERSFPQQTFHSHQPSTHTNMHIYLCVFPPTTPPAATLKSFFMRMAPGVFYFYCNFWHNSLPLVLLEFCKEFASVAAACTVEHLGVLRIYDLKKISVLCGFYWFNTTFIPQMLPTAVSQETKARK